MPGTGWIRGNAAASEDLLAQLNSLRNRLDVLVAENKDLKERLKPRLDGIAGLNETFRIRYSYKWAYRDTYQDATDVVLITWAEIFAACGPRFFRPTSPAFIAIAVVKYLTENGRIDAKRLSVTMFDSDEN